MGAARITDAGPRAAVGVMGGSGFYRFLEHSAEHVIETRWGRPSAPVTVGSLDGVEVAFLPRHGVGHELPPHRINYRANVDAMRQLGVAALLSPFAAGSLQPDIHPGDFVIVDQLVDRTSGRADTFHDVFDDGPAHAAMADPYDECLRQTVLTAARGCGIRTLDGGTVVVVNGPRFSTRAESAWFRSVGWHLVNMTQYPEAALAREAGLAYAGVGLVTDYDAGTRDGAVAAVTAADVFTVMSSNVERVRELLFATIVSLGSRATV